MRESIGTCLIVDDVKAVRHQVCAWLTEIGLSCVEAENGEAAWKLLSRQSFDLLVTDIDMPRSSGFDLLKAIRESGRETLCAMPALVISSLSDHEIESFVRDNQADTFTMKPLQKTRFIDCVFRTLRKSPSWGSFPSYDPDAPQMSSRLRALHERAAGE